MLAELHLPADKIGMQLWRAVGCDHCLGTGYRGRSGIHELLTVTEDIRRLVMQRADASELFAQARRDGMRTMFEDGVEKALQGVTTIEEVRRVTQA
jgi:general secretion pathway protein E